MYKCHLGWVVFSQTSGIDFGGLSLVVYLPMAFDLGLDPYLTLSCRSKANWFGKSEIGNESSGQQVSLAWQGLQVETFSDLFLGHLQGSFRGQGGNLKTSHVLRGWGGGTITGACLVQFSQQVGRLSKRSIWKIIYSYIHEHLSGIFCEVICLEVALNGCNFAL